MKFEKIWCIYYYPSGKVVDSFLVKKKFCKSLDITCKVVDELISLGNRVCSIENVECIIEF